MVIADIENIEGLGLISEVHQIMKDVPFVFITGYSSEFTYDKVIAAGTNDFIKKPFTQTELKNKLNRILKERRLAFDNQYLLAQLMAMNKKISNLLEIALDLTAEVDFDRLFHLIISRVTNAMNAERSSLYLIDWEHNEIWTMVAEHMRHFVLPFGEGISGLVAQTGEIINATDAWDLPCFKKEFDLQNNFRTKAVLCMPINNRNGERIAVIQVINKKDGCMFDAGDQDILKSLASQVAIALENAKLIEELRLSFESSIRTLSATVDAKHHLTAGHSERVTEYALLIGRRLNLNAKELEVIKYAGLLHDIGKVGIKDSVLQKYGSFTPEERAEMETHTLKTKDILENFRFSKTLAQVPYVAAHHHEWVNGEGYPDGLTGENIPLSSRILAVADVFDALTSPRDYPKYTTKEIFGSSRMPMDMVLHTINEGVGTQFDTRVVAAFLPCIEEAMLKYRGTQFPSQYVDEAVGFLRRL